MVDFVEIVSYVALLVLVVICLPSLIYSWQVVAYLKSGGSLYMNESLNVKHGKRKIEAPSIYST